RPISRNVIVDPFVQKLFDTLFKLVGRLEAVVGPKVFAIRGLEPSREEGVEISPLRSCFLFRVRGTAYFAEHVDVRMWAPLPRLDGRKHLVGRTARVSLAVLHAEGGRHG